MVAQVGELLDAAPAAPAGGTVTPMGDAIVLDRVSFRYAADGRGVLDGLSHAFAPGRISAIVGLAGSGKSSILGLINALRAPTDGSVRIGGVATTAIDPAVLRQQVVTVSQFPLFVTDTARANFQLVKDDATDAEIEAVCRQTGLWAVLTRQGTTNPLDVMLSRTAGQGLSGGERRLFAITRALLRQPRILLLDEPTTGIDKLGVQALAERLPALLAGLTVIIVEHDMRFVEHVAADICCLEDGRFTAVGSAAALSAYPSLFQRLKTAQETLSTTSDLTIKSIPLPSLRDDAAAERRTSPGPIQKET
jgi:ATP-binding cassette subfamily B protein